jgi:hypothetical protein
MTIATNGLAISNARMMRDLFLRFALTGAFAGMATLVAQEVDARGRGGGALRGGGLSLPRGGGGFGRAGALQRPTGISAQRPVLGKGASGIGQGKGPTNAANGNTGIAGNGSGNARIAGNRNGNTGVVGNANANSGAIGSGNGNTGVVGGNGNTNVVNNGNVVAGNNVDVDIDNGWGGWNGNYPAGAYATGVAVGATTAAAAGSYYSSLPAGCSPYVWSGVHYYSCGNAWYRSTISNGGTVYVVVSDPRQ